MAAAAPIRGGRVLDFSGQVVSADAVLSLSSTALARVESLSFSGCRLESAMVPHIVTMLSRAQLPLLRRLGLGGNRWSAADTDALLAAAAAAAPGLETLELDGLNVAPSGLAALASFASLRNLDLSRCGLGSEPELRALGDALHALRLCRLNLELNNVDEETVAHLASAVRDGAVEELNLDDNSIGYGLPTLSAAVVSPDCRLRVLSLCDNRIMEDDVEDLLARVPASRLEELDIGANRFTGDVMHGVVAAVESSASLRRMRFKGKSLEHPAFEWRACVAAAGPWSARTHRMYPAVLREAIATLLFIARSARGSGSGLSRLSTPLLLVVLAHVGRLNFWRGTPQTHDERNAEIKRLGRRFVDRVMSSDDKPKDFFDCTDFGSEADEYGDIDDDTFMAVGSLPPELVAMAETNLFVRLAIIEMMGGRLPPP